MSDTCASAADVKDPSWLLEIREEEEDVLGYLGTIIMHPRYILVCKQWSIPYTGLPGYNQYSWLGVEHQVIYWHTLVRLDTNALASS